MPRRRAAGARETESGALARDLCARLLVSTGNGPTRNANAQRLNEVEPRTTRPRPRPRSSVSSATSTLDGSMSIDGDPARARARGAPGGRSSTRTRRLLSRSRPFIHNITGALVSHYHVPHLVGLPRVPHTAHGRARASVRTLRPRSVRTLRPRSVRTLRPRAQRSRAIRTLATYWQPIGNLLATVSMVSPPAPTDGKSTVESTPRPRGAHTHATHAVQEQCLSGPTGRCAWPSAPALSWP